MGAREGRGVGVTRGGGGERRVVERGWVERGGGWIGAVAGWWQSRLASSSVPLFLSKQLVSVTF